MTHKLYNINALWFHNSPWLPEVEMSVNNRGFYKARGKESYQLDLVKFGNHEIMC